MLAHADVVLLAWMQFAFVLCVHFIFPSFSIGLAEVHPRSRFHRGCARSAITLIPL